MRITRSIGVIGVCCLLLSACAAISPQGPDTYVVRPQDTLYSIAWRHDLDYRDLANWNNLAADNHISVGQVLVLQPTAAAARARAPTGATQAAAARPAAAPLPPPAAPMLPPVGSARASSTPEVGKPRPLGTDASPGTAGTSPSSAPPPRPPQGPSPQGAPSPGAPPVASSPDRPATAALGPSSQAAPTPGAPPVASSPDRRATAASGPSSQAAPTPGAPPMASSPDRPATAASGRTLKWVWPTNRMSAPKSVPGGGILIPGKLGQPVRAAGAGRVVYIGSGLRGYGNLIIIKHGDSLLSAYAHNRELLVHEGQDVLAGQDIARMGTGPHQVAALYFEIRLNGRPVDPLQYLNNVR